MQLKSLFVHVISSQNIKKTQMSGFYKIMIVTGSSKAFVRETGFFFLTASAEQFVIANSYQSPEVFIHQCLCLNQCKRQYSVKGK